MELSVVVPVKDDPAGLELALSGLAGQTSPPDEILVVDAGIQGLPDAISRGAKVLKVGAALPGEARNQGARTASHPWVAFLDAGTQPVPGWLAAFRSTAAAKPEAQVLYGTYVPQIRDDWDWAAAALYLPPARRPGAGRHPTSASLCVQRSAWERLGGMRVDLRAGEDLLFFQEVERARIPVAVAEEAMVLWQLPRGARGHFRRLRLYSRSTWGTPLAATWQRPVLRMYLGALGLAGVTHLVHPAILGLLPVLAGLRLARNYRRRRSGLEGPLTLPRLSRLAALLCLVDAATLLGVWDRLVGREKQS